MSDQRNKWLAALTSPVGKKILTGITGIGLVIFIIEHMTANLSYFSTEPNAYNRYADFLMGLGPLIYTLEIGLLIFFVVHAVVGINIYLKKRKARTSKYAEYRSVGKPSMQTFSSRTMIYTGIVLLVFLVIHLWSFKFGPGVEEGYVVTVDGEPIRDLQRLMEEKFNEPLYAFGYPIVMILLGFHLRHGIWSAFQSLGAMNPRLTPVVYTIGTIVAILVALGFLILPLYIYFFVPTPV